MINRLFPKTVAISHAVVKNVVKPGDMVIDATAGNGYDTVFLAELVGPNGKVFSFDIQSEAIQNTRQKLIQKELYDRVKLLHKGHERIGEEVPEGIKAVMFNLGYLPRGNHKIITKPETTILALEKSIKILAAGGIIAIVLYTGHPGGIEESLQVERWVEKLEPKFFDVVKINYLNKPNNPPHFIGIQKLLLEDDKNED
ncbi:MAG: hypothetical protein PWQ96_2039 [Clostridia bacterium]|nr:hypothetical protein [Clostridia bacterium]